MNGQIRRLQGGLGSNDRNRVAEYLDTVREIERRIQISEKQNSNSNLDVPASPAEFRTIHRTHEADVRSDGDRVSGGHHANLHVHDGARSQLSDIPEAGHFGKLPSGIASSEQSGEAGSADEDQCIPRQLFSHVLERLKATPDGDGNLLDHSLMLYGSAMSNSNVHDHGPLPVLVAGGAAGRMKGGRHIKYPENTPMANLLMTILDKAGIPQESVGDSTGFLSEV